MKIVTWNVNGFRSIAKKGFFEYLQTHHPDILCIQETKIQDNQLTDEFKNPPGYFSYWHCAKQKGYSGVAVFIKQEIMPISIQFSINNTIFDSEGRVIFINFDSFTLFNVYFPNGQMDDNRLQYKLDFYEYLFNFCNQMKSERKHILICGDYNTAHKEIDLENPKPNSKRSGFLPVEREWIDRIIEYGYIDIFRHFNVSPKQYTWWSYMFNARANNIGWRIDYFFADEAFLSQIDSCNIQSDVMGSDHCPVALKLF